MSYGVGCPYCMAMEDPISTIEDGFGSGHHCRG
jgi:hypothetical protein